MNDNLNGSIKSNPKIFKIISSILLVVILGCCGLSLVGAWSQGGLTSSGLLALVLIITVSMMCVGGVIVIVRMVVNLLTGRKASVPSIETDGSEPAARNLNPAYVEGKPTKYAASLIVLGIGLFGLVANVVLLFFSIFLNPLGFLIPFSTILVGYFATKEVFEKSKLSLTPPTFWGGARVGMISGAIATLPILLLFWGAILLIFGQFYILSAGNLSNDAQYAQIYLAIFVFQLSSAILLVSGIAIVLSAITGGVTAKILPRRPDNPSEPESQAS